LPVTDGPLVGLPVVLGLSPILLDTVVLFSVRDSIGSVFNQESAIVERETHSVWPTAGTHLLLLGQTNRVRAFS